MRRSMEERQSMTRTLTASLLCIAMLSAASTAAAQSSQDAAANWDAVVRCAKLPGKGARHDCLDALLRDKGLVDQSRELSEARQSFGQPRSAEKPPTPAAPAVTAKPATTASAPPPPKPAPQVARAEASATPAPLKRLATSIASARLGPDRMLVLTTSEGAVWRQTQMIDMRLLPEKGDALEIEQAALGSHQCRIGSKIFRCQRAR